PRCRGCAGTVVLEFSVNLHGGRMVPGTFITGSARPDNTPSGSALWQFNPRQPLAGGDQSVLQFRILRLRVHLAPPQVIEILSGHTRLRIIAYRQPDLGPMRLVHIVGRAWTAHLRRDP